MDANTELFITLPVAVISIIFTLLNTFITIHLIRSFEAHHCKRVKNPIKPANTTKQSDTQNNQEQTTQYKVAPYFKYTALITVIFNTLCSLFNSLFCLYLILDPHIDDTMFYVDHPSHIYRILSTICWYIAQVSLIYAFTGRLYYTFHASPYRVNKTFIFFINIFNTITVFSGLICGYYGVFTGNLILAEVGLNLISRVLYEIISFIVLFMFSRRLLILAVRNESISPIVTKNGENKKQSKSIALQIVSNPLELIGKSYKTKMEKVASESTSSIQKPSMSERTESSKTIESQKPKDNRMFLTVTTRNAILMLTVSFSVLMVTFSFFGFRFIFGTQSRLTLLIPMNMAAFDSVNTSICMLCCFRYGKRFYYKLCESCDIKCKEICFKIARKYY